MNELEIIEQVIDSPSILERSDEYEQYISARTDFEKATGVAELVVNQDELDRDMVVSLESTYPGIVTGNVPQHLWYTAEGKEVVAKEAVNMATKAAAASAQATLIMVGKFSDFTKSLKKAEINDGLITELESIKRRLEGKEIGTDVDEAKFSKAYKRFMGVPPDKDVTIEAMNEKLRDYENPIQLLKDFPNNSYNKIFTPLMASTVAETSTIFNCFEELNNKYASLIVGNVNTVISDLDDIISKKDMGRLSRYHKRVIPEEVMKIMVDVIASLDIALDHKQNILKQQSKITKALAKSMTVSKDSLNKKASVVNAIANRHRELDKAFSNVLEATDKLAELNDVKDQKGKELADALRTLRYSQPVKDVVKGAVTGELQRANDNHRRLLIELDDVWNLVGILIRMSISYATCYGILSKVLKIFRINLDEFVKEMGEKLIDEKIESSEDKEENSDE